MQYGTITEEDRKFVETWANVAAYSHTIIRLDARGDEKYEVIEGPRRFMVTTEERVINSDRIKNVADDPFLNGSFRPVIVPDSVTVESNPNALSDEEIAKIFKSSDFAWSEWMQNIDSAATLNRMMLLAESADISLKRYKEIERRLAVVKPPRRLVSTDKHVQNFLGQGDGPSGGTGANTASDGAGNPRRQGGRSSDYR